VLSAQLNAAHAQTELARVNLENTQVRAPFDGTVLRKDAEVGEIVAPASAGGGLTRTAIVTMADLRTLEVEVDVNEAYIAQIGNEQTARITLDAYPDTSFAGRVRQVVPTADRQKATVQVKVQITNPDPFLRPEMNATVQFLAHENKAAATQKHVGAFIPEKALRDKDGTKFVFLVLNGKVIRRDVRVLGPRSGGYLVDSLVGGESVVTAAPPDLKDGQKIRIKGQS